MSAGATWVLGWATPASIGAEGAGVGPGGVDQHVDVSGGGDLRGELGDQVLVATSSWRTCAPHGQVRRAGGCPAPGPYLFSLLQVTQGKGPAQAMCRHGIGPAAVPGFRVASRSQNRKSGEYGT
jgi:hypothetical protein